LQCAVEFAAPPPGAASGGPTVRAAIDAFLDTPGIKNTPNTLRAYTGVLDRTATVIGADRTLAGVATMVTACGCTSSATARPPTSARPTSPPT
jgi:hypothetical protein